MNGTFPLLNPLLGAPLSPHLSCLTSSGEFLTSDAPISKAPEAALTPSAPVFQAPRLFLPPPVRVYSNPDLIPWNETRRLLVVMQHGDVSTFHREAVVDLRDIRFIHTLSEGRASALVSEKVDLMRLRLAIWRGEGRPEDDPESLLSFLTRGNKSGTRDQIMVGRLRDQGDFYLLNGHRRVAALCILAVRGEIPLHWLTRLPVWHHEIADPEAVARITAGTILNSENVLSEIVCGNARAAEALRRLEPAARRTPVVRRFPLPRRMMLTSLDHRLFLDLAERGGVDASFSQAFLRSLKGIAARCSQLPANFEPYLEGMERLPGLSREILRIATTDWALFREFAVPLHRAHPEAVREHLRALLNTAPLTRNLLSDVHLVGNRLKEAELIADLGRFRAHPDPLIREYALSQAFGAAPGIHASILYHAAGREKDEHVRIKIELALKHLIDSFSAGFPYASWGQPELWIHIAFWLKRAHSHEYASRAGLIAERLAERLS